MRKGSTPAPIPQTITSHPALLLKFMGGVEYPMPSSMKARNSKNTLMSVRNALDKLTEVNTKKSTSAVLGATSPDAIGKSFFRIFALSFS
jgi:hypothetical protein